jgi:hypothetical protein
MSITTVHNPAPAKTRERVFMGAYFLQGLFGTNNNKKPERFTLGL